MSKPPPSSNRKPRSSSSAIAGRQHGGGTSGQHFRKKNTKAHTGVHGGGDKAGGGFNKPPLVIQPTTLWDYPSQHYGDGLQGDPNYIGATPSYVIWNLLKRYTREGDVVVDPCCGSGTTIDVCKDLKRFGHGFDLVPAREDIQQSDARELPLDEQTADFVFIDPPYSNHLDYSEHEDCIGKTQAADHSYYAAMADVFDEINRILKPGAYMAVYVSDSYVKGKAFHPVGV